MRPGPIAVRIAAGVLAAAALTGCGLQPAPQQLPDAPSASPPTAVVAPPVVLEPAPLSPPVEVPMPEVPTVVGPYVPPPPPSDAPRPPGSTPPAATPAPAVTPTPTPRPTAAPSPEPTPPAAAGLAARLPAAASLPPLAWHDGDRERTAAWSAVLPARELPAALAIAPVAAARDASAECAAIADAAVAGSLEAASASYAADPAPGAPFDLALVRYPSDTVAREALTALRALGVACAGVPTADGTLGTGVGAHGAIVLLRAGDAALVVESAVRGELLVVVQHEGAPPEAVTALLAAVR
ncbi:hypothetical protein [Agrococcus carbonis]|nr:hypothetical protein [Agrococcus carbonis]